MVRRSFYRDDRKKWVCRLPDASGRLQYATLGDTKDEAGEEWAKVIRGTGGV